MKLRWGNLKHLAVFLFICFCLAQTEARTCQNLFYKSPNKGFYKLGNYTDPTNIYYFLSTIQSFHKKKEIQLSQNDFLTLVLNTVDRVSKSLTRNGIPHKIIELKTNPSDPTSNYQKIIGRDALPAIQILPHENTYLGKLATYLFTKDPEYRIVYDVIIDLYNSFGGYVSSNNKTFGLPLNLISKLTKDEVVVYHELRHFLDDIEIYNNPNTKVPYLVVKPLDPKSKLSIEEPTYENFVTYNEVFAYFESVRFGFLRLRKALRLQSEDSKPLFLELNSNLSTAIHIGTYFEKILIEALTQVFKESDPQISDLVFERLTVSKMELRAKEAAEIRLKNIPKGTPPNIKKQLLINQLSRAIAINRYYLNIYRKIETELSGLDLRSKARLKEKLDELQPTLVKWNLNKEENLPSADALPPGE